VTTPLYGNRNYYLMYIGIWMLIASIHLFILTYYQLFGFNVAITESLVSNLTIALLGLSLWYPVFYLHAKRTNLVINIIQQLVLSIILSGFWFGITYMILATSFSHRDDYLQYLIQSIPWRLASGVLYYFLIILFYNLLIYYQNFKEKLVSESELKALIKESELSSLKSQINPHFLFNSLNSISSLTILSPEKAREMIIKLSEFLRYSLSKNDQNLTTVEQEINNISRYLDIEKIRFGKRLVIKSNINDDCMGKKLPWLILQPLVENAIKYGVYENLDESVVELNAACNERVLQLSIKNNFDPELIVNKGEGIGLQNIRQRMKIIYNSDNLIQIKSDQGIYEVLLSVPQI